MKKLLTRLSSVLLLVTIVISAISMSGHVFAQTDSQNQNNIVDVETDENQSTKVILQSSEGSLEKTLQENNENYEKVGDDTYIVDYESVNEATKAVYDTYSNDDSVAANEDALFFTMTEDGTDGTESSLPETENTEECIPSEIPKAVPSKNTAEEAASEPAETAQSEASAVPEETEISPAEEPVQTEQGITDWHAYAESLGKKLVAVIDTGVSNDYASVQMNFTDEADEDENGHGTEVAKTILENSNDSAVIMSLKAMGKEGTGYMSNIMKAIQYAKDQHADIINMSISAPDNGSADIFKQLIRDTIAEGTQFVVAAGNYNSSAMVYIPSDIDGVISVGAADENGRKIDTSNYGATYYETADSTSMASAIDKRYSHF